MNAQSTIPPSFANRWVVAGAPGEDPHAGRSCVVQGYESDEDGRDVARVLFDDGSDTLIVVHMLFPEVRAPAGAPPAESVSTRATPPLLTPESLLAFAEEAEATYQQLLSQHPAGTIHAARNAARDKVEMALVCADWLARSGRGPLAYVGPFGELPFKRGGLARIKRGAIVRSTNPSYPREGKAYAGTRPVKVHSIDQGYVTTQRSLGEEKVSQPRIHWAGTGGYWCWVDANDAEPTY